MERTPKEWQGLCLFRLKKSSLDRSGGEKWNRESGGGSGGVFEMKAAIC